MIEIAPLDATHAAEARRMILEMVHLVYEEQGKLEELQERLSKRGVLKDMDDVQANYFARNGIFFDGAG